MTHVKWIMCQYEFLMQFWKGKRKQGGIHRLARSYQRMKIDMALVPCSLVTVMGFCKPWRHLNVFNKKNWGSNWNWVRSWKHYDIILTNEHEGTKTPSKKLAFHGCNIVWIVCKFFDNRTHSVFMWEWNVFYGSSKSYVHSNSRWFQNKVSEPCLELVFLKTCKVVPSHHQSCKSKVFLLEQGLWQQHCELCNETTTHQHLTLKISNLLDQSTLG